MGNSTFRGCSKRQMFSVASSDYALIDYGVGNLIHYFRLTDEGPCNRPATVKKKGHPR